jgi:hypothetical protein
MHEAPAPWDSHCPHLVEEHACVKLGKKLVWFSPSEGVGRGGTDLSNMLPMRVLLIRANWDELSDHLKMSLTLRRRRLGCLARLVSLDRTMGLLVCV